jgi:hypothetical protein
MSMEVIYLATATLTKLSILMFYRRITSSVLSGALVWVIRGSIVFGRFSNPIEPPFLTYSAVSLFGPASILALILTCDPVEAYWYRFTPSWLATHKYTCTDEVAFLVAVITLSTVQDFLACMVPMYVVAKLRLPWRQKLGLAGVFGMGLA